jgi:2-polyprenyl-3-methyl-5-hydroxy-6-metoxy-1,4-benzoquinol methylase
MAAQVVDAFKSGQGIPWSAYGESVVDIQGEFNRPWLVGQLGTEYLPAIPNVHDRLQKPGARFLDVACGVGWASIATARAYPNATVLGIDMDAASIERANENARNSGLADRVKFECRDAASLSSGEPFDAAIIVEAVHDMSNPVAVLAAVQAALAPGASLVVIDENVSETFTAPGNEIDRFMYSASVMLCLPNGMSEQPSAATGTVMRPATFEGYARAAGFAEVNVLPLEHPMFRFYEVR